MSENESIQKGKELEKARASCLEDRTQLLLICSNVSEAVRHYGMDTYDADRLRALLSEAYDILEKYEMSLMKI